ncbi:hypothetical protein KIN20_015862 [Parelaphostrongylus tenuis]|uniref:Uncharacterized protein n=1 Tax=Parelaphostrongylus tenuis TaxID=148309 RepID=A0AAD5N4N2_PARTN|nr:hypothetical protein KIN20_015862 [Parelaphostrongylus tenuis]
MAGLRINRFVISLLAAISTTLGCGVMPAGQMSTRNFTVTDFTLPVAMAYSHATDIQSRSLVLQLAKQELRDLSLIVLESQGRSALLPDAAISTILSQLDVRVSYKPLMCQKVHLSITDDMTRRG